MQGSLLSQARNLQFATAHLTVHVVVLPPGSADITTGGATSSLGPGRLLQQKTVVAVRHGLTSFNLQNRIQGSSNESRLTSKGKEQAELTREALERVPFDACVAGGVGCCSSVCVAGPVHDHIQWGGIAGGSGSAT